MAKQTFTTGQVLTAGQMTSLQQTAMGGGAATAKTASYVLVAADAGTVVAMNSASATTVTVNTGLFAAGDTVQIQNLGAGVLTVTAGTATVSTSAVLTLKQYDAGTLYFVSTGVSVFFSADAADSPLTTKGDLYTYSTTNDRLAVGNNGETLVADSSTATGLKWAAPATGMTNPMTTTGDIIYSSPGSTPVRRGIGTTGQVLTVSGGVPSWATLASGGMTSIASGSLSGSSISITSIPSTYNSLMLTLNGFSLNNNGSLKIVLNNVTTTSYNYSTFYGGSATGLNMSNGTTDWIVTYANTAASQSNQTLILQIPMYEAATSNNIVATSWCAYRNFTNANWQIDQTNLNMISTGGSINRIDVLATYSGAYTFDAGTYTLWGIK